MADWNQTDIESAMYFDGTVDLTTTSLMSTVNPLNNVIAIAFQPDGDTGNNQTVMSGGWYVIKYNYSTLDASTHISSTVNFKMMSLDENPVIILHSIVTSNKAWLFVNYTLVAKTYTSLISSSKPHIGSYGGNSEFFKGYIGRIQVYGVPPELYTYVDNDQVVEAAAYLAKNTWSDSPSTHWELGDSLEDQAGSKNLIVGSGNPTTSTHLMWVHTQEAGSGGSTGNENPYVKVGQRIDIITPSQSNPLP